MLFNGISFGNSFQNLHSAIRDASIVQNRIAADIANIQSSNYYAGIFQTELEKAQKRVVKKEVLLDRAMAKLAENNLKTTSYINLMSKMIQIRKKVVTLGKGG